MSLDNKSIKTTIRLSEEEHGHIRALAEGEGMSLSDYVRRRLFEDYMPDIDEDDGMSKQNTEDHNRMMRMLYMMFAMTQALSEHSLSREKLVAADQKARDYIKQWGYE